MLERKDERERQKVGKLDRPLSRTKFVRISHSFVGGPPIPITPKRKLRKAILTLVGSVPEKVRPAVTRPRKQTDENNPIRHAN